MLNALALVAAQVFLDLALVVGAFVNRDADLAAGRGQGAAGQAGMFALDVEEADFTEGEGICIEPIPGVHVAANDVMGQVVEIVKADPLGAWVGGAQPLKLGRIGAALVTIGIDQIQQ